MSGSLAGKVVLVAGVGPGLGQALALRSAAHGADVVLAARSADRLGEVAGQVRATGRRALAVPTDLTDPDAAAALIDATQAEFGRLDTVIANAFTIPAMRPLLDTDPDRIRAAIELTVIATIGLARLSADALEKTGGSIVAINSMVLRHSQIGFGSYKIAKAGLLAAAQSLATELGPRGIRVNSIAPGYIWGENLQSYYAHLAEKHDTTVDALYAQTAADTDLGRLPEPGQIADAAVFLASDMASAITGQCLAVDCGQYHH